MQEIPSPLVVNEKVKSITAEQHAILYVKVYLYGFIIETCTFLDVLYPFLIRQIFFIWVAEHNINRILNENEFSGQNIKIECRVKEMKIITHEHLRPFICFVVDGLL